MHRDLEHDELLRIDGELERLSRNLVSGAADSDDDRQEAWLSASEGIADQSPSLFGWLVRAMKFRGMSRRRAEATRRKIEAQAPRQACSESAQDILERSEVRMRLIRAVSNLKQPYRQTINLLYFEALDTNEVARVMNVPRETVRTRTRRGLDLLRQQLDAEYGSREIWAVALLPAAMLVKSASASSLIPKFIKEVAVMSGKTKFALATGFILVVAATIYQFATESTELDLDSEQRKTQQLAKGKVPRRLAPEAKTSSDAESAETQTVASPEEPTVAAKVPRNQYGEEVGRVEVTVTYGKDGDPASDLPVTFLPFQVVDPFFREQTFRTNKAGVLVHPGYPVGSALIRTPVGGYLRAKIKPAVTNKFTLVVPLGSRIVGTVQTPNGKPVVGAEIVAGEFGSAIKSEAITKTDMHGQYTIANFGPNSIGHVGARAKGQLPSALVMVFPSKGNEKTLNLILGGPASRAILEIVDTEGEPVGGARCIAGTFDHKQFSLPDGNKGMKFSRTDDNTGKDGKLVLDNLSPGELEFTVRAYGYAAHRETITIKDGPTTYHRVVLSKGGVVKGVATGADGLPLEGVQINVGRYGDIASHFMRTDANGRYRFDNVALGKVKVSAEKKDCGDIRSSVVVTATEPTIWNPTLKAPDGFIRGVVLDDRGNPVEGLAVSVNVIAGSRYVGGFGRSDKNGRFKITGLEQNSLEYGLVVRPRKGNVTLVKVDGVRVSKELVRVTVPSDAVGAGTLTGRIVDHEGQPVRGATISGMRQPFVSGGSTGIETTDNEGRFLFEDLPPGPYRFSLRSPKLGSQKSDEKTAINGQTIDVGDIVMQSPAFVIVNAPGLEANQKATIQATSLDGGSSILIEITGPSSRSQPLAPGHYRLKTYDREMVTRTKDVNLEPGETYEVTMPMAAGRLMTFSFAKESGVSSYSFKLLNMAGVVVAKGTRKQYREHPLYLTFTMGSGSYTLHVEDGSGRTKKVMLNADSANEQILDLTE